MSQRLSRRIGQSLLNLGLRTKVAIVFVGMLVFSGLSLGIVHRMMQDFNGVATTVSVAGKLRMLGQKLAYETLSFKIGLSEHEETVEHDIIDFESAYLVLRNGGVAFGESLSPLPATYDHAMNEVWRAWQPYRNQIRYFLNNDANVRIHEQAQHAHVLDVQSWALLARTDDLIAALVQEAQATQDRAFGKMALILALSALASVVAYLAMSTHIVEPLQRLAQHCRALAKGQYGVQTSHVPEDEIGQLARALNQSGKQIGELMKAIDRERQNLRRTSAMFNGLARNAVTGVFVIDGNTNFRYVNRKLAEMFGYRIRDLVPGMKVQQLLVDPRPGLVKVKQGGGTSSTSHYETRGRRRDGTELDLEVFSSRMILDGEPATIGIMLNVTERKKAEISVRRAALVYANTSEAVVVTDALGVILDANPAFSGITGYRMEEVLGRRMSIMASGRHSEDFYREMWNSLGTTGRWSGDIWNRRKDGTEYIERLTIDTSYNEDGSVNCHIGLFSDVTAERMKEEVIWHQAHYDHLTGLPNRQMFHIELQKVMHEVDQKGGCFALVYLDLDYFKEVNDSLGHDKGDELLKEVAARLQRSVTEADLVARLGGDEFTLLLRRFESLGDLEALCERVLHEVAQPYMLGHHVANVSASLGTTVYPGDAGSLVELLQNADLAMYDAKDAGRNQYRHFSLQLQRQAQQRREMLKELHQALERREFEVYFQPIVDMATGRIFKAETLLRWHHPVRGMVGPSDFIPLSEDSGLIVPIGDWAFRRAAEFAARWRRCRGCEDFQLSVNVSPAQFMSDDLDPGEWITWVSGQGIPPSAVMVEITERLLMRADGSSKNKLLAFRDAGIQVALDDFGTGYSSLAYLKRFDIDYIKIDQMFVRNITTEDDDQALCQAIIAMAHRLGLKVVAEGVETAEQHALLMRAGCDFGQGYFYSRPLSPVEFEALLVSRHEQAAG